MTIALRLFLAAMFAASAVYTLMVAAAHGINFLPVFFGDIGEMGWPGQFNLDFLCMLLMGALWTAWRNEFTPAGLLLGLLALSFGPLFLTIYLLVLSVQTQGNLKEMLLGKTRAG